MLDHTAQCTFLMRLIEQNASTFDVAAALRDFVATDDFQPTDLTDLLVASVFANRIDITRLLFQGGADIADHDHYVVRKTIQYGTCEMLQVMLDVGFDLNTSDGKLLRMAVWHDRADMVALLLEHGADARMNRSAALRCAWTKGTRSDRICAMLYDVSDPQLALAVLQEEFPKDIHVWGLLQQHVEADAARLLLTEAVHRHCGTAQHNTPQKTKIM